MCFVHRVRPRLLSQSRLGRHALAALLRRSRDGPQMGSHSPSIIPAGALLPNPCLQTYSLSDLLLRQTSHPSARRGRSSTARLRACAGADAAEEGDGGRWRVESALTTMQADGNAAC